MSVVKNICIQKRRGVCFGKRRQEGHFRHVWRAAGVRNQTDLQTAGWQRETEPGALADKDKRIDDKPLT